MPTARAAAESEPNFLPVRFGLWIEAPGTRPSRFASLFGSDGFQDPRAQLLAGAPSAFAQEAEHFTATSSDDPNQRRRAALARTPLLRRAATAKQYSSTR